MKKHSDEFQLEFSDYNQLSYMDFGDDCIELFCDGESVGWLVVYTDRENEQREYIVINNEIVYLDTIKLLN